MSRLRITLYRSRVIKVIQLYETYGYEKVKIREQIRERAQDKGGTPQNTR